MDLTIVAYGTLALSLFVSAVKMGGWILNADPRTLINAGRWSLLALTGLVLALLGWLVNSGRWAAAMMLAAFMLPVLVQAAPRWRALFGLHHTMRGFPPGAGLDPGTVSGSSAGRGRRTPTWCGSRLRCCGPIWSRPATASRFHRPTCITTRSTTRAS